VHETSTGGQEARPATRRHFLTWMSRAFLGLWGLGAAGVVGAFLRPRGHSEDAAQRIVAVGMMDDFPVGEARLVRHGTTPFYVVRLDLERVTAVSAVCTHVRCILDFNREQSALVCPCHAGRFDLGGRVLSGPPPKPLAVYEVSVRAGELFVHL